jgi:hypothetical protein
MGQEKQKEKEKEKDTEIPLPPPEDPEVVAARVTRRLFMGAALFLALGSIYGGMLGLPWGVQVGLVMAAVFCLFKALRVRSGTF